MQYLPSFLCQLIDAVAYKNDPAPFLEDWEGWKTEFDAYYARESDYALSEEDSTVVQNLPVLLEQLNVSVQRATTGEAVLDELITNSVAFFAAHDSFYNERERHYFVQSAPIDRLLKACIAHLQDRGTQEAVHRRQVDAALAVDVLHSVFQATREELPEALVTGSIDGFRRAEKAFNMLADHPDEIPSEVLEEVIFELKSAGELLEHIPNLVQKFQAERGAVTPLLGEYLSTLRSAHDEDLLTVLREEAFPAFLEMWDARQDAWLLQPDMAAQILEEANQALGVFGDLLENYPDQADEFWAAADQVEDVFGQIKDHTMELEPLRASPYWPEAQLLLNLLRGGAPIYAAQTVAAGIKGGDAPEVIKLVGRALESYLQESEPLLLLEALDALQQDLELSRTTRPCASCSARIPLEAKTCPECGAKVEEFSLSG